MSKKCVFERPDLRECENKELFYFIVLFLVGRVYIPLMLLKQLYKQATCQLQVQVSRRVSQFRVYSL